MNNERSIKFEVFRGTAKFLSPLMNMNEVHLSIEHRKDPLTGRICILSEGLRGKEKVLFGETDSRLLEEIVDKSANCFMCSENVEKSTPKYSPDVLPEGRLRKGEAVLFPNLFPTSEYHAVVRLTEDHFRNLSQFSGRDLTDGFELAVHFIKEIIKKSNLDFATINGNFLFPSGASVVHPHFQILVGKIASTIHQQLLSSSQKYYQNTGKNYWLELTKAEKSLNQRFISEGEHLIWLTSFAPIGNHEIVAIVKEASNFQEIALDTLEELGKGMARILKYYEDKGISTYNFSFYSGPLLNRVDSFRCVFRIISRPNIYQNYRNDDYFLQKLLGSEIVILWPEDLAKEVYVP
ncbi:MAG: hypothetical protein ACFFDT_09970 [Candidatus Hodarchaeota archaeon]